ncbi:MAG: hypothetical protein ABFC96_16220 [Thermoguttaceae bacterium]
MSDPTTTHDPPLGLGLTAVVLGSVGLLLFFMPVLGVPLGGLGVLFGLAGLVSTVRVGRATLRWSIAGTVVSALALAIGLAIAQAPSGYGPSRPIPLDEQPVPQRPFIPPPER